MGKNKLFLATLATAVVSSSIAPVGANAATESFTDVTKSNSHYVAIMELANRGIINGYSDGTFGPKDAITRGQAAKIIVGALGLDIEKVTSTGFTDVAPNNPYASAIVALKQLNVINGLPDGTYRPNDPITRNHMAKILTRALNLKPSENVKLPFTDVNAGYKEAITALFEYGITLGTTATTFGGNALVTREQFASFIVRAEKATKQDATTLVIESISQQVVKSQGKEYKVSANLQALLNEANAKALAGATTQVKVVKGEIVSVTSIELNTSGTADAAVILDGQNTTFTGNVKVSADYVELKNVKVTGNVTLTKNASSHFVANEIDVQGELVVEEVEASPTASLAPVANLKVPALNINLVGGSFGSLLFNRPGAILNSSNSLSIVNLGNFTGGIVINANIGVLRIPSANPKDKKLSGRGTINAFEIMNNPANVPNTPTAQLDLQWDGIIAAFTINNPLVRIQLGLDTRITRLIAPASISPSTIFSNPTVAFPNVGTIQLPDGSVVTVPIVTPTTGGGGSGSITPAPSPTPSPEPQPEVTSEQAMKAVNRASDVLENDLAIADNVYYQYGEQKYLEFELKAFEKFIPVFQSNAPFAGYDLTEFNKYPINGKIKMIYSWLYYSDRTASDFNSINSKIKSDIALLYKALEADTPTTTIAINDQESQQARDILLGSDSPSEDMFLYYYGYFIGLDLIELYESNDRESVVNAVLSIEKGDDGTRFNQNIEAIELAINDALTAEKNKKINEVFNLINKLGENDLSSLGDYLSWYDRYLSLNFRQINNYSPTSKNIILQKLMDAKPIENVETLRQVFESAIQTEKELLFTNVLTAINSTSATAESVRSLLEQNAGVLGLDVYNYYRILDVSNRQNVAQAIINNRKEGYNDIEAVKVVFANTVETEISNIFNNAETLGLFVGKASSAAITPSGTKVFKMDLTAEQLYALTSAAFFDFTSELAVYRLNGSSLERVGFYNGPQTITFKSIDDGTYYLVFKAYNANDWGTHVLSLHKAEKLDGNLLNLGISGYGWFDLYDESVTIEDRTIVNTAFMYGGVAFIGKKHGSTIVTITIDNYDGERKEVKVPVTVADDLKVTFGEITNYKYTTVDNDPYILGITGTDVSSSTEDVATVELIDGKILINPLTEGATTITVKDADNKQATIDVTVDADLGVTTKVTKYTPTLTSVKREVVDGTEDNLIFTFSDAVYVDYYYDYDMEDYSGDYSLSLNGGQATYWLYTLSSDRKTLTIKVPDAILATAETATVKGVYYGDSSDAVTIENQSIPLPPK